MVISCAAVNCTNRQGKVDKTEISFHRFPINNARRLAKWKRAVRRESWTPNKYSFLCSKHFSQDCFQRRYEDQHRQLKATAVPSIFDFSHKAKSTAGNVRKKVLSTSSGAPEEEQQDVGAEDRTLSEDPCLKGASKSLRSIPPSNSEPRRAQDAALDLRRLPPPPTPQQQAVGEWSLDSGDDVFTPSSCTFIDTLHSYSSTSRQERDTRARQRRCEQRKEEEARTPPSHTNSPPSLDSHPMPPREASDCSAPTTAVAPTSPPSGCQLPKPCRGLSRRRQLRKRTRSLHALLRLKKSKVLQRARLQLLKDAPLNPAVKPLEWLVGSWESDGLGQGSFPSIRPFNYTETLHFYHVGQPVLNFMFNAFHPDTKKPMHRECGFIRMEPGTQNVAFINAQNTGLVEIEEGELNGLELTLQSRAVARISFAKEPYVQQISRTFRLKDGKLEQTVFMSTENQPLSRHLHITYRRTAP
ncbi:peroxynitrite isomerase THAP4 isoform X2 [Amia ocellicauda]|uniref:peroxynitrite isomerase THAP4 isoform X2 n=1 Tax=Amia ocellicauda TaxID=2972642 RepID=UPI003464DC83